MIRNTVTSDGVVCLAGIDWWYHNRGHSECQIMQRIARSRKVLWVNSIGMRMPAPGKTEIAWTRYTRKARSLLHGLSRDASSGMYILSPLFIPSFSEACIERNGRLVLAQIRAVCRFLGIRHPALWATLPTFAATAERGQWTSCVVNRCDSYSAIADADTGTIEGLERRLLSLADHALYVSHDLLEEERSVSRDAQYLGHGVDFQGFSAARPLGRAATQRPEALRGVEGPIVGFFGAMDDYRVDKPLLLAVARHISPANLVLIGPAQMDLSEVLKEPNVKWVGQVPHAELPRYAGTFDVGIIPFLRNEFNRRCNPVKLKEYLALGFPIVATRLPAYEGLEDVMCVASDHSGFLAQLDLALSDANPEASSARRQRVEDDSWDNKARRVEGLLGFRD